MKKFRLLFCLIGFSLSAATSLVSEDEAELDEAQSIASLFDSGFRVFSPNSYPVRTLRSKDGNKEIEAEILDYDAEKKRVKISKVSNKRIMWFDIGLLSLESQELILDWYTKSQIYKYLFFKAKALNANDATPVRLTVPKKYEVEVRNMADIPIKDLKIYYRIHKKKGHDRKRFVDEDDSWVGYTTGMKEIDILDSRSQSKFDTDPIYLLVYSITTHYITDGLSDGSKTESSRDGLAGIQCRVVYKDTHIKDWKFPENLVIKR